MVGGLTLAASSHTDRVTPSASARPYEAGYHVSQARPRLTVSRSHSTDTPTSRNWHSASTPTSSCCFGRYGGAHLLRAIVYDKATSMRRWLPGGPRLPALLPGPVGHAALAAGQCEVPSDFIFTPPSLVNLTRLAVTASSVGFAIWTRGVLEVNWSGTPPVKERHILVADGPQSVARNPIYTVILLGLSGSSLLLGPRGSLCVILLTVLMTWGSARVEERLMHEQFERSTASTGRRRRLSSR